MGAHVGPEVCHITGRRLTMELRVATALFGHMGMELDLREEPPENIEILKAGIVLHKQHRELLHTGEFQRLDTPPHVNAVGVVSADRREALFSWCNMTGHRETVPGRIFFAGLDPDRRYKVQAVWPHPIKSITKPSILDATELGGDGVIVPGEALMQMGLQVPLMHPETCIIYRLES